MVRSPSSIPTDHSVLKWAREYRGFNLARASEELGVEFSTLQRIESGDLPVTSQIFNKMVRVYRQPESVLLLPYVPESPQLPTDYRTAGGKPVEPSPETIWAIREVQAVQEYVSELVMSDSELIAHANIVQASQSDDPDKMAQLARRSFPISFADQRSGPSKDSFIRWRVALQQQGILVFVKRMAWDDCRGFSLYGEGLVPVIVVNHEDVPSAKTFTLFHEYGHLMLEESGLCIRAEDSSRKGRVERWCNEFSAAFLIPSDEVLAYVKRRFRTDTAREWAINEIKNAANWFHVSRSAMALRLQKLDLAPFDYYERNKSELEVFDKVRRPEHGNPPRIRRQAGWHERQKLQEVGLGVVSIVLEGWKSGSADPTEAADALEVSLDQLSNLEEYAELERIQFAGP